MMNLADIAGTSAAVNIQLPVGNGANGAPAGTIGARSVYFVVTGAGTVRVAGQNGATPANPGAPLATSSFGLPVTATTPLTLQPLGSDFPRYQANEFSVYVPTGTTLSVAVKEG